jgi:hypothetical protein
MCVRWNLTVVLICISLIISNVKKPLPICLLDVCISSLKKCPLKSFDLFFGLGYLIWLSFSSLYTLAIIPWLDILFEHVFFHKF